MNRSPLGWLIPRVFAHRCGGALAPENSLSGLRVAAQLGCRAVEFDVMLSADGSPWLMHDETLERTTNGVGRLCDMRNVDLYRLDAGFRQHPAFSSEPLPTLEDAAVLCRQLDLLVNIEIKPATGQDEKTGEIVARRVVELWHGASLPLVSSFSLSALEAARAVAPQLPIGCLWECPPGDWRYHVDLLGALTLHYAAKHVDDDVLAEANAIGVATLCYTVNDSRTAQALFERGVTAVFSDRIDRVVGESFSYLPQMSR